MRIKQSNSLRIISILCTFLISSCRTENTIVPSTESDVTEGVDSDIKGFFLLNEGNMSANKASLDYFNYSDGKYHKNIYAERNPTVAKELGDVGNDIAIWEDKLYAVINNSNLVEVMDMSTAKHIASIPIPNCRFITFKGRYAYVSSYAGAIKNDPNKRLGYIAKVDTETMSIIDSCTVGYQPEQMVIIGNNLYVANSGGYTEHDYDNTVSVVDLASFKEVQKIEVAINLNRMTLDSDGMIWVSSRGDYYDTPSKTFVIDPQTNSVTHKFDLLPNSDMTSVGDSLYVINFSEYRNSDVINIGYTIVNTKTKKIASREIITDGTDDQIRTPYGIAVNPNTREILITDAGNYITPGKLYCFTPKGELSWSVTTGDFPSRIVFTHKELSDDE